MMSTSTRTSPWQYEWKRPQWEKLPEDRAGLIDVTAAQVLGEEVGLERQDASKPLVLTVSLYDNGNILFLDVQDRTSQLKRRELRWPRSIMADESICSISLCRKPVKDDKRSHEDALEVLNRMALIPMFSTDFKFDTTTTQEDFEDIEIILQEPERPELVLACLTSRGNIMLYQVSQLLLVDGNDSDDQLAFEMANLILGVNLLEHIHQTMRPLSQPYATIALSVPFQQPAPQQQENPFGFKLPFDFKPPFQLKPVNIPFKLKQQEGVDIGIWDGSVWNARVEPSSAVYRTLNNEPINCTFLLKFLAVLGRGTRMRRTKKQKAGHGHADSNAGSVVDSTDTPSAERDDKEGRPEWLKENEADKFSEEAEWWKILEEDDIDVHEHNEVGGFVSFVGLLEAGEMRTVYLPFVPKAVYPLEWGGILFAIVIADDDCVYNCPKAVAIRLDTSGPSEVYCGATIGSDLTVDKDLQKKVKIKRFQPIPIDLPQEDQVSSTQLRVLGASKFYTQPPGMTILHAEGTTDAKDVVLTYHTLKSFDYVSSKEIDGWTKKDEFVLAVRTEKKQSHVAIVPNQVNEDAINKSWCEVGQVSAKDHNIVL